jgi:hypothetical protein
VSGLDLLTEKGQEGLEKEIKDKVKGIETVTHVYFFGRNQLQDNLRQVIDWITAYIMDTDPDKEIAINVKLLDRAVKAVEHLSPNLKFIVLPTGTKVRNPFKLTQMKLIKLVSGIWSSTPPRHALHSTPRGIYAPPPRTICISNILLRTSRPPCRVFEREIMEVLRDHA